MELDNMIENRSFQEVKTQESAISGPESYLMVVEGPLSTNKIKLSNSINLAGSDPSSDIWLPYSSIKPIHFILARTERDWFVRSTDSNHLVSINGKSIVFSAIKSGDRLGVGSLIFEFQSTAHPLENIDGDSLFNRHHAALMAAQHVQNLEYRWLLLRKEANLTKRARKIGKRLRLSSKHSLQSSTLPQPIGTSLFILQRTPLMTNPEEKLGVEEARLARLREKLLKLWKGLSNRYQHGRTTLDVKSQRLTESSLSVTDNPPTNSDSTPLITSHRSSSQSVDLSSAVNRLSKNLQLLSEIPEATGESSEQLNDGTETVSSGKPNDTNTPRTKWETDSRNTVLLLEQASIDLANRMQMISEREALLETLLEQRQRQKAQLEQTIRDAVKNSGLANARAERAEIETARLRCELAEMDQVWNKRIHPHAENVVPVLPEDWSGLKSSLERLSESLKQAVEWVCQAPDSSERAELEYLRFHAALHRINNDQETDKSLRSTVNGTCEIIHGSLITRIDQLLIAAETSSESPDRRMAIEVHRWRIRAEAAMKALEETRALLDGISGDSVPPTNTRAA
jgi:hypothetical protein